MPMSQKSYESEIHNLEVSSIFVYSHPPPNHTPSQETVEAYKQQNRFLSSELVELNAVRAEDSVVYKSLDK